MIHPCAPAATLSDAALTQLTFDQKLNAQVSTDLAFTDENGTPVQFGDLLHGKPVILVLGYYQCPMLCTFVLNGMVESLEDIKWNMGKEFEVINVSISPEETPTLAAAKKRSYLNRYGRTGAAKGWHFLTGKPPAIETLAREVGFHYAYDPASRQYAHPSGLVVLTPQGKVSGYLFGVTYAPGELFSLLQKASANQVSSPIRKLILLCFHYNPITGKYGLAIMVVLRVMGALTLIGLGGLVFTLRRRYSSVAQLKDNLIDPAARPEKKLNPASGLP